MRRANRSDERRSVSVSAEISKRSADCSADKNACPWLFIAAPAQAIFVESVRPTRSDGPVRV